jgi:Ca-activated chloride channel family protein
VLAAPKALRESRWPLAAALAAWTLGSLALAGPTWERLPVPVFRSNEALVIALDLSRSMDAGDVVPSRLARAKLKLLDLLERRDAGQTGLVVFSTHGYTVTPLTTDTRTIASLTSALASDLMPSQGSAVRAGLERAAQLLTRADMPTGDILVMTDADVAPADTALARELVAQGYRVHVLAVGTAEGASIPEARGGFVSDPTGRVVLPQVDARSLRALAAAGGGRFAALAADDSDLDALFPDRGALASRAVLDSAAEDDDRQAELWLDRGPWLVLLLLPLLALGFRRGWIAVWVLFVVAPLPRAQALEWEDLWQRADQRGFEAFEAERVEQAAELFADGEWRAAAHYRAGQFEQSAATLAELDTATAHYNRGNALAKAGKLEAAIAAYDRTLELEPEHADARYNRDLLEEFLQENPEQREQQQQQSGEEEEAGGQNDFPGESEGAGTSEQPADSSQASDESGEQEGEQSPGETAGSPENGEQRNDGARGEEQLAADEEQDGQDGDAGEDAETDAADGSEPQSLAAADDLEEWASEQAAEQWLRRIPQDPGGLLRRKFLYQYQRYGVTDETGVLIWPSPSEEPW